jgi:hypothetical protein
MTIDLTQIIIAIIGLAFTGVIIPLGKALFVWLKGKTQNEAILAALTEAEKVADQVVASLQVNVVEGIKAKSVDGKLSVEDIKDISVQAFDMFISDISQKSLALIADNADDIGAYVKNLIESRLLKLKG